MATQRQGANANLFTRAEDQAGISDASPSPHPLLRLRKHRPVAAAAPSRDQQLLLWPGCACRDHWPWGGRGEAQVSWEKQEEESSSDGLGDGALDLQAADAGHLSITGGGPRKLGGCSMLIKREVGLPLLGTAVTPCQGRR